MMEKRKRNWNGRIQNIDGKFWTYLYGEKVEFMRPTHYAYPPEIVHHKKVIANKKKEINKQLTEIPARIDELNKSVIDVSAYDVPK